MDVSKPTDRAVRKQGLLFPPHTTGGALKFSSIQIFLTNGQISGFSNPTKTFLMINETELAQEIIFARSWTPRFFSGFVIIQSFCVTVYFV